MKRFLIRLLLGVLETVWFTLVLIVLLIWILPDFLPKRRKRRERHRG